MSYGYTPIYPTTYGQPPYSQQYLSQQQAMRPAMPQPMQPNYICRPVANEDEARAVPTDFTGATTVLVDSAHGSIYTKVLNPIDGSAVFTTYRRLDPAPQPEQSPPPPVEYAPMSEVEQLRKDFDDFRASLQTKRPVQKGATAND